MKLTLKAIRINKGWSQEVAAKKFGISVDTLSNYENYKTYPDVRIVEKIIRVTGMHYDDIIFLPKKYAKSVCENENIKS